MQSRVDEIRKQGLGLAVISYDSQEVMAAFAKLRGITFPLLADPGSATIKRFGILNPVPERIFKDHATDEATVAETKKYVSVVRPAEFMTGMAFPGTFMLDKHAKVTARFFEDFYVERNTVSSMLVRLGNQGRVAGTRVSSKYLDLETYPSDSEVAFGNRIAIVVNGKPHPGMHVYAPGAQGYKIVRVNIDPQPHIRTLPVEYPASEIYDFKPLKERVPVYQKPFTLIEELVVEGDPAAQAAMRGKDSITITGSLDYQACDAKECYNPVSIPLSWTAKLRSLVTERPTQTKQ